MFTLRWLCHYYLRGLLLFFFLYFTLADPAMPISPTFVAACYSPLYPLFRLIFISPFLEIQIVKKIRLQFQSRSYIMQCVNASEMQRACGKEGNTILSEVPRSTVKFLQNHLGVRSKSFRRWTYKVNNNGSDAVSGLSVIIGRVKEIKEDPCYSH
jgi:hypothetical protein